jgi:uracil-DNA glycosylase family 4
MDAFAMLRLQIEWGADDALDTDPVVRLREVLRPAPAPIAPRPAPAKVASSEPARGTPAERALAAAGQASNLEDLRAAIAAFDGCALRDTAGHLVFAEGDPTAGLLLIGEAPGADEDRTGHVFAGREGALLDKMLASIHLKRDHMLMTPLIPWRPPGGRPPNPGEIAVCLPFLHRLISLARPTRVVLLGALAAHSLLPATARRRRSTPAWVDAAIAGIPEAIPFLPLPGMSALLKNPLERREAWAGLRLLRRALDGT